jgi:hypothetical protein
VTGAPSLCTPRRVARVEAGLKPADRLCHSRAGGNPEKDRIQPPEPPILGGEKERIWGHPRPRQRSAAPLLPRDPLLRKRDSRELRTQVPMRRAAVPPITSARFCSLTVPRSWGERKGGPRDTRGLPAASRCTVMCGRIAMRLMVCPSARSHGWRALSTFTTSPSVIMGSRRTRGRWAYRDQCRRE